MLSVTPVLVKDIHPGPAHSNPTNFVELDGVAYFAARQTTDSWSSDLWKTDGTEEGTVLVRSFPPGNVIDSLKVIDDRLYFYAEHDEDFVPQFWTSDGTEEGTHPITNLPDQILRWYIDESVWPPLVLPELVAAGDDIFFAAREVEAGGFELWKLDDSPQGASIVRDINPGPFIGSNPRSLMEVDGRLYFTILGADNRRRLWTSDGTFDGTRAVSELPISGRLSTAGGMVYFTNSQTLWRYDPVADEAIPIMAGASELVVAMDGLAYFGDKQGQLWKTDGTTEGTVLVATILPGSHLFALQPTAAVGGVLYINTGVELWKSDGTAEGTAFLAEFDWIPTEEWTLDRYTINVDGRFVFMAFADGATHPALFASNGTPEGTVLVADNIRFPQIDIRLFLGTAQGKLFYSGFDPLTGQELYMLPASAPGDANNDGFVDGADFTIWADHYLKSSEVQFAQGDFNRDGVVDGADFTIWADNYAPAAVLALAPPVAVETEAGSVAPPAPSQAVVETANDLPIEAASAPALVASAQVELALMNRAPVSLRQDPAARHALAWAAAADRYFAVHGDHQVSQRDAGWPSASNRRLRGE